VGPGKIAPAGAHQQHGIAVGSGPEAEDELPAGRGCFSRISNTSFQQPVAQMSVGGRGGGGASLTQFGSDLVAAYRGLEAQIRKRAQTAFSTIKRCLLPGMLKPVSRSASEGSIGPPLLRHVHARSGRHGQASKGLTSLWPWQPHSPSCSTPGIPGPCRNSGPCTSCWRLCKPTGPCRN